MKKFIAVFLGLILFFTSFLPFLATPLSPQKAYAKENCIYYVYDGQGNIRFVTDEVGNKVRSTEYDPFGNWRAAVGQADIHMLYQGQQQDAESNLYYLRARYYDPLIGRFISRDPVKGSLILPQTQNPYAYAGNNPVNNSDPNGEFYLPGALFLGGGLALAGMEVGGAIYGAATSCDTSLVGRAQGALTGMQNAVESPAGQVALGAVAVGLQLAASPQQYSSDFTKSPGSGWVWKGSGPAGSSQGSWVNQNLGQSIHPDYSHPEGIVPHADWLIQGATKQEDLQFRLFLDGSIGAK